jgi:phosphatidylglycerophosphate synthase
LCWVQIRLLRELLRLLLCLQAMHQVVNVPNMITVARIAATPYLAHLIVQGDHVAAIGCTNAKW